MSMSIIFSWAPFYDIVTSLEMVREACFLRRDPEHMQGQFWCLWGVLQVNWCCPAFSLSRSYCMNLC